MLERVLILIALLLVGGFGWMVWHLWLRARLSVLHNSGLPAALTDRIVSGKPSVLYFTSEGCVQCKFQQAPVLERISCSTGVVVHQVDALSQSDLADFFGVMTVPTTIVLDPQRRPVAVNYGLAPLQKLQGQLESVT